MVICMEYRFEKFTHSIFEISKYWHKLTAEEMKKYGLRGPHAIYLLALVRHPEGITAPKLCELCGKDKADVSRMMSIMEEKGLVKKEGGYSRSYGGAFVLTTEGIAAAEHVRTRSNLAVAIAGKDLTDNDRDVLYYALEMISSNLKKLTEEGIPQ